MPKSASAQRPPASAQRMLSGLMSRCRMPWACAQASPSSTASRTARTCAQSCGGWRRRLPPAIQAIASQGQADVLPSTPCSSSGTMRG